MKAKLNGIELEYQDGGRGPAVLPGHGYSATGRMWDGQRAALGDRWRIISWDMRGQARPIARAIRSSTARRKLREEPALLIQSVASAWNRSP